MYTLKHVPEDFIVEEIAPDFNTNEKGKFLVIKVVKRGMNTEDVAKKLSDALHIQRKDIGYCGAKDKHAITFQYMSIKGMREEQLASFTNEKFSLEVVGSRAEPLTLGEHKGNTFTIIVRNLTKTLTPGILTKDVANYFGEQRFQYCNADIGRFLVKKQFVAAAEMIAENNEFFAKEYVSAKQKQDPVRALLKLPRHTLMMYLHAYQSMLWNQTRAALGHNAPEELVVIGFGTELDELREDVREIYEELLKKEDVTTRDFIIKQLRGLSPEGETRTSTLTIEIDVSAPENDDSFPGKKKQEIKFSLPTGAYATVVAQHLYT